MDKEGILAHLHLHAVLPRLEELVKLDPEAAELARQVNANIRFWVKGGPSVTLNFAKGTIKANSYPTDGVDIGLAFASASQLNALFTGGKAIPIPYKGFLKLKHMKTFGKLTEMMTRYLKPSEQDLKDPEFAAKHVEMALMVGLSGAGVIADYDQKMQKVAKKLPDGKILFTVSPNGPHATVVVERRKVKVTNGPTDNPDATLEIKGVDLAVKLLANDLDTFAALGAGNVKASGLLPLADEFNALVDRVGYYLA